MFKRVFSLVLAAAFGVGCGLVARKYTQPKPAAVESKPVLVPAPSLASAPRPAMGQRVEVEPYPTGYVLRGSMLNVFMSDGTVRTERDSELSRVERNSITLGGKKMFFKASPRGAGVESTPDRAEPVAIAGQSVPSRNGGAKLPEAPKPSNPANPAPF